MILSHLSQAFVLGLSMGPACLGYCAPVCVPLLGSEEQANWRGTARLLGTFLLGRLAGYTLIGAATGIAGALLFRGVGDLFWGSLRLITGVLLILFGLFGGAVNLQRCTRPTGWGNPVRFAATLGLFTGLNLCPPFAAAIIAAAETGSIRSSLTFFWAFFAGTSIYFVPLLIISPFTRMEPFRHVARICLFLAGAWLAVQGGVVSATKIWPLAPR